MDRPAAPPPLVTNGTLPQDRVASGKSLRTKLSRTHFAKWKPTHARDPLALLRASDVTRVKDLVPIRYGRMLQSPFVYFRGASMVMAADLAKFPTTGIRVQACGDCHLLNFGGFATPERNIVFSINDFDETLPAPWEWDVQRLVASFVLASRANGHSDANARDAAETAAHAYRKRIRQYAKMHPLEVWYSRIMLDDFLGLVTPSARSTVRKRAEQALARPGSEMDFPKLAGAVAGRVVIRDKPPLIFHPEGSRGDEFQSTLRKALRAYRATLAEDRGVLLDRYHIADAAMKVVGVGSVGMRCWVALLMSESNDPLFLQFKEAVASVLEPYAGKSAYAHHGQRVVIGQQLMQPASDMFLGWVTAPTGVQFYVRQLRDAKIKPLVETFSAEWMLSYAKACGWALALSHAKGSDVSEICGYLGSSDQFDDAMGKFALAYADEAERDHAALKAAVRKGKIAVYREV
jgi:uncharacterized protein (DUF2252 family)